MVFSLRRCLIAFTVIPTSLLLSAGPELFAQEEPTTETATGELSLEDILNLKVTVASKKETTIREQPGIVTVVTHEQMRAMGARDLQDVVRVLVPGFHMVMDYEVPSVVAVRGLQVQEGKMSLMIDGHEMNETKYGTIHIGANLPIDYIDRVEIIRGPGSSVYGGYAAIAAVNIITKGPSANATYSNVMLDNAMPGGLIEERVAAGSASDKGTVKWAINSVASKSTISMAKEYKTYQGRTEDMTKSQLQSYHHHVQFTAKVAGLTFDTIVEKYAVPYFYTDDPDVHDWSKYRDLHTTLLGAIKYDAKIGSTVTVTPYFSWKDQKAYWLDSHPSVDYLSRNASDRKTGGLSISIDPMESTNIQVGFERYVNGVRMPHNPDPGETFYGGGSGHVSYSNNAIWVQAINSNPIVNVTLGVRYDKTDVFGDNTAPRIGFTKVMDKFHFKGMLAQSFKVPGGYIGVAASAKNREIKMEAERATNKEIEVGYQFTDSTWLAVNFFDIILKGLHKFEITPDNTKGTYINGGDIGTRGFEVDFKVIKPSYDFDLNLSNYKLTKDDSHGYEVAGHEDSALGVPNYKTGFSLTYKVTKQWHAHTSGTYRGTWYSYDSEGPTGAVDDAGEPVLDNVVAEHKPDTVLNLGVRYKTLKNLDVDVTLHNLTDQENAVGNFTTNRHSALPSMPRSLTLAADYTW